MNDEKLNKIIYLLENIYTETKKHNNDKFLENLYDGILIGVTSGLISGLLLYFLT